MVVFSSILVLSCSKNVEPVEPKSSHPQFIVPLEVGDLWVYQQAVFSSKGLIVMS